MEIIKTVQKQLASCTNEEVKSFLSKTLDAFGRELNIVAESMYRYPDTQKGIDNKEGVNDVFALIERSYVGLYNNAIIRSFSQDSTLQEFSVYKRQEETDTDKSIGRADFLVRHLTETGYINLLFEAKAWQSNWKKYSAEQTREYYKKLYDQAFTYFEAEKLFYTGDTYIITISFDWIRKSSLLDKIVEEKYEDDGCTHFYYIYHTGEAGLMVYGNVTTC